MILFNDIVCIWFILFGVYLFGCIWFHFFVLNMNTVHYFINAGSLLELPLWSSSSPSSSALFLQGSK